MEYQAVVMAAGRASRMVELTSRRPKCLMPICNKPMIWYSLKMLEKAGFEEAIVVVQDYYKNEVAAVPSKFGLTIRLDIVTIPKSEEMGTADSLRYVQDKLKAPDVVVVSSDLVTDIPLHNVFNLHRIHNASATLLFGHSPSDGTQTPVPGPKAKHKQECDLVGLDLTTSRLVFLASEADFEEELTLSKHVFKSFPQINVESHLIDAHFYLLKKWVCDYLGEHRSLSMLKGEVLPHLVRKQFAKAPTAVDKDQIDHSVVLVNTKRDIFSYATEEEQDLNVRNLSLWNDHSGDLSGPYRDHSIRCYAHVTKPEDDRFCIRANTLSSYCELNRQVIKRWSSLFPGEEPQQSSSAGRGQVGSDCLVADSAQLSDKCTIKTSIIGKNCIIEDKVRITNCIIMDNVTIKEGTSLQGCVLLDRVTVEARCDIKDCLVASELVHSGTKSTNEMLIDPRDADRLLEI